MRKKRKKNKKVKIIFIILMIAVIMFLVIFNNQNKANIEYEGKGALKVNGKDEYTTTFTTLENNKRVYKEYKQGNGASWSDMPYWDNKMWDNGCGITAISIIASGYGKNITPEDLRKKYYPHLEGNKIENAIKELGILCGEFQYTDNYLNKEYITEWLNKNKPVLVCVNNKPATKWTTSSHYLVLLATDKTKNYIYVSNPNASDDTSKSSGGIKKMK